MRGFGLFFGSAKRNDPVKLVDPNPIHDYGDDVHSGSVARDGYELLSRADPARAGSPPPVPGTEGPVYQGPDQSFEQ